MRYLIGTVVLLAAPAPAIAQQCSLAAIDAAYPAAVQSIEQWENSREVKLTDEAKGMVLANFCDAAAGLRRDGDFNADDINQAAPRALADYLDQSASGAIQVASVSEMLVRRFYMGSGPAIPGPRALGRIAITYRKDVDALVVAGKQMLPFPALLSKLGRVRIVGLKAASPVCSGEVVVLPAAIANFTC